MNEHRSELVFEWVGKGTLESGTVPGLLGAVVLDASGKPLPRRGEQIRYVRVTRVYPYAQYESALYIDWLAPRQRRNRISYVVSPSGGEGHSLGWYQVKDVFGNVKWDSRELFPVHANVDESRAASQRDHERLMAGIAGDGRLCPLDCRS